MQVNESKKSFDCLDFVVEKVVAVDLKKETMQIEKDTGAKSQKWADLGALTSTHFPVNLYI